MRTNFITTDDEKRSRTSYFFVHWKNEAIIIWVHTFFDIPMLPGELSMLPYQSLFRPP